MLIKRFHFLIPCLLLIGCASQNTYPLVTATSLPRLITPSQSPVATLGLSQTPDKTGTPNLTATSILPQLALTLTPLANNIRVTSLFESPVCKFPCWWNITPGLTSWEDANSLITFLGLKSTTRTSQDYMSHDVKLNAPEPVYKMRMTIFEKDGIVEYIALRSFLQPGDFRKIYSAYEPQKIIQSYGVPSRVSVFASLLGHGSYTLNLFYDAQGFLVSYGGSLDKIMSSGDAVACPDFSKGSIGGAGIYMQAEDIRSTIENFPDDELQTGLKVSEPYMRSLENATGLTLKEFTQLFVGDTPSYCFTILKP